ncbi:MAG: nucleotidyltransferase family protein [Bacteroidota bacterium]
MIKEAIVLAGGKGTRLRSVVSDVPKPMADINGRPFLAYLLDDLAEQGVETCILAVGYKREVIFDYFGESYKGMSIKYSIEEEALGTGGAIKLACNLVEGEEVLAINGDTFFQVDLKKFYAFFTESSATLAMALKEMEDFERYGTVKIGDDGRIMGFEEKKYMPEGLINGGVYLFRKSLLLEEELPQKFSFETDILEKFYDEEAFYGTGFDSYFIDIGIPEDYEKSKHDLAVL